MLGAELSFQQEPEICLIQTFAVAHSLLKIPQVVLTVLQRIVITYFD
jgi:hypothetical protein